VSWYVKAQEDVVCAASVTTDVMARMAPAMGQQCIRRCSGMIYDGPQNSETALGQCHRDGNGKLCIYLFIYLLEVSEE